MAAINNMMGQRFERLEVISLAPRELWKNHHATWVCVCDCGNLAIVSGELLRRTDGKNTRSCGCLQKEVAARVTGSRSTTHGMHKTPEWRAWRGMRDRCSSERYWEYYGSRGIKVCAEWENDFETFFEHVGEKPEPKYLYSLDRIDNDGNYEPGNVRWATDKEQMTNRRCSCGCPHCCGG